MTVHETGSFSLAAEKLGVPRSTVSRAVASLESALGTRLFQRTTRKVSTSTAGVALYERLIAPFTSLEASLAELPERVEVPSGRLRVTTTVDLGYAVLAEATARFTTRYPEVSVEVHLGNDVVDLVRDGFDLALRVSTRKQFSSSLVAQKVGAISIRLYASAAYLARRSEPRSLADLAGHDWVGSGVGALKTKTLRSRIEVNEMTFVREAIKSGAGIGLLPSYLTTTDVLSGGLVQVIPKWAAPTGIVYLVQPSRQHQPRKVSAFRDVLVELLKQRPL